MNIANWLTAVARERPDAPAVLHGRELRWDYGGLRDRVAARAASLGLSHGVGPGERVVLYAANDPDYLATMFAIWWAGGVIVPVNVKLSAPELARIVRNADARVVIADDPERVSGMLTAHHVTTPVSALVPGLLEAPPHPEPVERRDSDLAWIFYTSGTTGAPKGAMLSHGNLVAASASYVLDVARIEGDAHYLYAAPISHGAGLYAPIHVRAGSAHVFPESHGFDPGEVLDLAAHLGGLSLFAAPTMVRRLTRAARAAGGVGEGLDTIVYGGGPMYLRDVQEALETFGPRLAQIYGQGESPMTICALPKSAHVGGRPETLVARLESVGRPHSVVEVRITDAEGSRLPAGEIGEIEVRGSTVMSGYWQNPEATAEVLHDGWLRTGDLGEFDASGLLTLKGRSKELIISGGSNIYPREVEDVLMLHPDVDEAAVVGVPDPEWGEIVVAFVTAAAGRRIDPALLDAHCLVSLARFKRPKSYLIRDDLPKNAYGKVVKTQLAAEASRLPTPEETLR
jgi:acyl-CoA synthetase (AMP-forming)/AMP-acid ligase II